MTGKLKSQNDHSESRSKTPPQTVLKAVLKKEEQM